MEIDYITLLKIENPPMDGWCSHKKACRIFDLIKEHKPKTCLEIGTFGGRSLVAFAFGLKHLGRGIVFGIDPWNVPACLEGTNKQSNSEWWSQVDWQSVISKYFDKLQEFDVLEYVAHFRKHDTDCLDYFAKGSIDMVHFDSNHSEEVACRTVKDWWPKLKQGCVVIMDDIDWDGQKKAIKVMQELGIETVEELDTYGIYIKR